MIQKGGLRSPRENIGSLRQKFDKSHIDEKYYPAEPEKNPPVWDKLMQQLVVGRK